MGRSADIPRSAERFGGDDSGCTVLHVDMDAFFASVEIRRRPELTRRPVIVGGEQRGVVSAASYEARRYGVRSAMSMSQALRLCPHAVVVPPDRAAYLEASRAVLSILREATSKVEQLSIDEAFLDVAGSPVLGGSPMGIAAAIRRRVAAELALTCSVGVAPTKFVAKLASTRCKPDGLLLIPAAQVLAFLHPLPVTVLWGVGARTAEPLRRLGIRTVADLAATPADTLRRAVGASAAARLHPLANGVDPRPVQASEPERSISADHTTAHDLTAAQDVRRELLRLSDEVAGRLRARRLVARTVGIKIRFADFRTLTRVRTLAQPADDTATLYRVAGELFASLALDRPRVRLVGVKAENLDDADRVAVQLTLDDELDDPRRAPTSLPPPQRNAESARLTARGVHRLPTPASARRVPSAVRRGEIAAVPHGAGPATRPAADGSAVAGVLDAARSRFGAEALGFATLLGVRAAPRGDRTPSTGPAGRQTTSQSQSTRVPGGTPGMTEADGMPESSEAPGTLEAPEHGGLLETDGAEEAS